MPQALRALILLAWAGLSCSGQSLSFSPQPRSAAAEALLQNDATIWVVTACAPPGTTVPAGRIYEAFEKRGYSHITRALTSSLTQRQQRRSWPARIVRWSGYGAAGTAVLMSVEVIKANRQWQQGATAAAAFFGFVIPLAQKEVPVPDTSVTDGLIRFGLVIDSSGCGEGMIMARRAGLELPFQVELK